MLFLEERRLCSFRSGLMQKQHMARLPSNSKVVHVVFFFVGFFWPCHVPCAFSCTEAVALESQLGPMPNVSVGEMRLTDPHPTERESARARERERERESPSHQRTVDFARPWGRPSHSRGGQACRERERERPSEVHSETRLVAPIWAGLSRATRTGRKRKEQEH